MIYRGRLRRKYIGFFTSHVALFTLSVCKVENEYPLFCPPLSLQFYFFWQISSNLQGYS